MADLLASVREGLSSGLSLGLHPMQGQVWRDGRNVIFRDGGVRKMGGWSAPFAAPGTLPIRGMGQHLKQNGVSQLYFGDINHLWKWDSNAVTQVGSGYTGSQDASVNSPAMMWSLESWGDWMLATNGKDGPLVDKNDGNGMVALAGATFTRAEIFIRRGTHMIALNTSNGFNWVEWCHSDDVNTWAPTASNSAGNLAMRDIDSPIMGAVELGSYIAIYTRNKMFLMSFLGAPFIFGIQPALTGIGVVGKKALCSVGRQNYGLSEQGFWTTDGAQFNYFDDPILKDYIQKNINWAQASKVCCVHDQKNAQIIWFYPSVSGTGENDSGVAYDYKRNAWTLYDFGRTAALGKGALDYLIQAAPDGKVYFHNSGVDADGVALHAWVQTRPADLGDATKYKFIERIYTLVKDLTGTFQLSVGTQEKLTDSITWYGPFTTDTSFSTFEEIYETGAFITLKFESVNVGDDWQLDGFDFYGYFGGDVW